MASQDHISEDHIRNPVEWGWDQLTLAALTVGALGRSLSGRDDSRNAPLPAVLNLKATDLRDALVKGLDDLGAYRTDVIFLCLIYPLVGIALAWVTFGYETLPLLFPLASGFALVGPVAAVGLYEMSRRREQGLAITWVDAFGVIASPAFGAILVLGLVLLGIFLLWLVVANVIYDGTLGPEAPASIAAFASDVFTTRAGWAMILVGVGVGFLFAVLVLAISVVSFPLLLDRDVGLRTAVLTSVKAVTENPGPMALWGLIIAGALVIGSIPAFLGLIIVIPVLGHATWHLYRKVVEPSTSQLAITGVPNRKPVPQNRGSADEMAEITKGRFGYHRGGCEHEPPTAAYIQIYVKASVLSQAPDLAISTHLTTEAEIDDFVDDALTELEQVRIDAKKELAAA
jgi:uncharacterized membrane protein